MSTRNHIAIFERFIDPADNFGEAKGSWEEVCKEWVSIKPLAINTQRGEFVDTAQTRSLIRSTVLANWSPTLSAVTTKCRMKVARPVPVNSENAADDANYRIFEIDSLINYGEQNRELQMFVVEKM